MDRMCDTQGRLDDQIVHLVSRGKVQNVVVGGVAFAIEQLEQRGRGPVDIGTDAVERPFEDGGDRDANFNVLRSGKVALGNGLCDNGDEALERLVEAAVCHCAGGGGGVTRRCCGAVAHNSLDVESHCVCGTAGGLNCSAEPVVISRGVGLDNYIVTLADTNAEEVRCEGSDGDKVSRNDCQAVAIERDTEVGIGRSVDETELVLLAVLKGGELKALSAADAGGVSAAGTVKNICPVDETVLGSWGTAGLRDVPFRESCGVVPVSERHGTEVHIVVGGGGPINNDGAGDTLSVLKGEVRVIPGGTVLSSGPFVGEAIGGGNWAWGVLDVEPLYYCADLGVECGGKEKRE